MRMPDIIKHAEAGELFAFWPHAGSRDFGAHHTAKKVEVLNPGMLIPNSYIEVRFEKDTSHENDAFHEDGTRTSKFVNAKDIRRTWEEQERMQPIWNEDARVLHVQREEAKAKQKEINHRKQQILDRIEALEDVATEAGLEVFNSGRHGDRQQHLRVKGLDDNEAILAYLENLLRVSP